MRVMKSSFILVAAAAAALGAQEPTVPAAAAPRDTTLALDRIVAVVGVQPITQYDVQERVLQLQQQPGFQPPRSQQDFDKLVRDVVGQLIDEELLVQKAEALKVELSDGDLNASADRQIREVRGRFSSDAEFRAELLKAGLGTPDEYRRFLVEQLKRNELQQKAIQKLRQEGKIPPVNVTEAEVEEAFNRTRSTLPRRPATVTFRQIVVAPKPSAQAREAARVRAESLLAEIRSGAEFERVARRESADSASREQGGDLGWNRRGRMVAEFERWMFALRPGAMSPVIETVHGFHIIRVDRVQPGEVKSRHILIRPVIDSADVARARLEADTVAAQWAAGTPFDTLARRHHDYGSGEETSILTPIPVDSGLPPAYREAMAGKKPNDIVTFAIPGIGGNPKYVVAQLLSADAGGEYTLSDLRERVRSQLVEEGSIRRFLDGLRKEFYVSIRLEESPGDGRTQR